MLYGELVASGRAIISRPFSPSMVVIGEPTLDNTIDDLSISLGGRNTIKIEGVEDVQAYMKYLMEGSLGADVKVGMAIKVATGFMGNTPFQFQANNSAATTPEVRGYSQGGNGQPILGGQETIDPSSNLIFRRFTGLFFPTTNFNYANITFSDGHQETEIGAPELRSMFIEQNQADADGELGGYLCIDNKDKNIIAAQIYATSGGQIRVTNCFIPM